MGAAIPFLLVGQAGVTGQLYMGESGPACIVLGVAELGATDLPTTCLKDHMVLVGFGRVGSRLGLYLS
jgi:hypothetical protein